MLHYFYYSSTDWKEDNTKGEFILTCEQTCCYCYYWGDNWPIIPVESAKGRKVNIVAVAVAVELMIYPSSLIDSRVIRRKR